MTGYAASRRRVEKVDLGDGYYAVVRKLNRQQIEEAEQALSDNLMRQTIGDDGASGEARMRMDSSAYRNAMLRLSVTEWNMDGECALVRCSGHAGDIWPVDDAHVRALDGADFNTIWRCIDRINQGRSKAEQVAFRAGSERGDHDGHGDVPSAPGTDLPGADVLDAPRP